MLKVFEQPRILHAIDKEAFSEKLKRALAEKAPEAGDMDVDVVLT